MPAAAEREEGGGEVLWGERSEDAAIAGLVSWLRCKSGY
jgi:hypothetical protein